ncbi:MAG: hypothetical protein KUG78_04545 [Kangiellaceae bacterium]|nr:hypothetical protein [Kangiellaceae bacterium]
MTSIWLPIGISLIAAITYLWSSAVPQKGSHGAALNKASNVPLILMFCTLIIAPLGYWQLGSLEKQHDWLKAQTKFSQIQRGLNLEKSDNEIQDLILALRTSIDLDPSNGQLWFLLAESYFQLRMIDLADASMERALRIEANPDWLVANAQILTARSNEEDIGKSIRLLSQAIRIQPDHQSALLTLGFIQMRRQRFPEAISSWKKLESLLKRDNQDTTRIVKQIEFAESQMTKHQTN